MVSVSSLVYGEYDDCVFPVFLTYLLGMPAGIGGWDTGMSWGKEGWRRRSLGSIWDGVKKNRESSAGFQIQRYVPYSFMYLNTWSLPGGFVLGDLEGVTLLEVVCHWVQAYF